VDELRSFWRDLQWRDHSTDDPFLFRAQDQIISLAARQGLPAMYPLRQFVDAGALMSYAKPAAVEAE